MDQFRFFKTVVESNRTSFTSTKGCAVKRKEEGPEAKLPHRGAGVDPPPNANHMSFVDFVVLPPWHGRSVTDF